jgi:two-component system NarL family response regulator
LDELRIVLAGGAPLLQAGIVAALSADDRLRLVARLEDAREAGEYLRRGACDIVVLNTESPRVEAAAVIAGYEGQGEGAKLLVLTDDEDRQELLATLQAGVQGYGIRRTLWPEDIRCGVLSVGRGFRWTCPQATRYLVQLVVEDGAGARGAGGAGPLSPREVEVLRLAGEGAREERIAATLCLSPNTVKTYFRRIREKLQATTRVEAVRLGYEQGLIPAPAPHQPGAA